MHSISRRLYIAALAAWLAFYAGSAHGQPSVPLVIDGEIRIDGNGGAPVENSLIIIEQDKIRAVGARSILRFPDNSQVIRADGKFILPGLMNAHSHYQDWMPEFVLTHGVTGIFEIGGGGKLVVTLRDAIARGKIAGRGCMPRSEALPADGFRC